MKFDVCVMNPPYGTLYLRVMDLAIEKAESTVAICPGQFALQTPNYDGILKKFKDTHNCYSHIFIKNGFDDAIFGNFLIICAFDERKKKENWDDICFERFSKPILTKQIYEKYVKYAKYENNLSDHCARAKNDDKFYVNTAFIRGNLNKDGSKQWSWTTLFGPTQRTNFSYLDKLHWNHWEFCTIYECKNFIKSCETDIIEYAILISKTDFCTYRAMLKLIPWLGDYTHEWTEEMIQKELGITDEELEYIHEEMKDFGWKVKEREKK